MLFSSLQLHSLEPWDRSGTFIEHSHAKCGAIEILPWQTTHLWVYLIGGHHPTGDSMRLVMADFENVTTCAHNSMVPNPIAYDLTVLDVVRTTLLEEEGYTDFTPVTIYVVDTEDMSEKKEILELWKTNLDRRARDHALDAEMVGAFLEDAPLTVAK